MKKAVLTYGVISGMVLATLLIINCLIINKVGFDYSIYVGYAGMVLSFAIIYPGMVAYRNNAGGGYITYGRALAIGLLITVIACLFYVAAWAVIYHSFMPDFLDRDTAYMIGKMKANGTSAAELDKTMTEMNHYKELYKNPVSMCLLTYIEPTPVGIVMSLILAFAARKKRPVAIQG